MPTDKETRRARTAELLETALGKSWRVQLADALGMDRSAVRRYFANAAGRDDAPPEAILALAELLAATDPAHWPARWR